MIRLCWQPRSAAYWVFVVGVLVGAVELVWRLSGQLSYTADGVAAALPIVLVAAALVAGVIVAMNVSQARVPAAAVMALLWGAVAATGIAMQTNGLAGQAIDNVLNDPAAAIWGASIAGPIDEETIKALGVLLLLVLFRSEITRPLQGFTLGAFVGLGFQVVENLTYASTYALKDAQSNVGGAVLVAAIRAVTGFQSHWVYTGVYAVGLTVLLHRGRRSAEAAMGIALSCGAVAYLLHFWWNAPGPDAPLVTLLLVVVKCAVTVVVAATLWGLMLTDQRNWLRAKVADPAALALAPADEIAALPTAALRRNAVRYIGYRFGPAYADIARARQRWLLREFTRRA